MGYQQSKVKFMVEANICTRAPPQLRQYGTHILKLNEGKTEDVQAKSETHENEGCRPAWNKRLYDKFNYFGSKNVLNHELVKLYYLKHAVLDSLKFTLSDLIYMQVNMIFCLHLLQQVKDPSSFITVLAEK